MFGGGAFTDWNPVAPLAVQMAPRSSSNEEVNVLFQWFRRQVGVIRNWKSCSADLRSVVDDRSVKCLNMSITNLRSHSVIVCVLGLGRAVCVSLPEWRPVCWVGVVRLQPVRGHWTQVSDR